MANSILHKGAFAGENKCIIFHGFGAENDLGGEMMKPQILAVNPGSSSTKVAWFEGNEKIWQETVHHDPMEIAAFPRIYDQYEYRLATIKTCVADKSFSFDTLSAVVGRGGFLDPTPAGTYGVDDLLIEHLRRGVPWDHASNLGGILARAIAQPHDIPAFIVDPVTVDELDDIARITGLPEFPKRSMAHTLNVKATVRRAAADLGKPWDELDAVVAHLGSGITICAHCHGRMIDLNNADDFGPFSPERAGGLPAGDLVRLCYSGKHTLKEIRKRLLKDGGLKAYLGVSDVREVNRRIQQGDEMARKIHMAMAYQVAREIGACSTVFSGRVDVILITGGVAFDSTFVRLVQERVQWIAPVLVYPGEDEMQALAEGALRVVLGEEEAKRYGDYVREGV